MATITDVDLDELRNVRAMARALSNHGYGTAYPLSDAWDVVKDFRAGLNYLKDDPNKAWPT